MPATHQIPKGARVLPTPDWFTSVLTSAGTFVNPGGSKFSQVALFNNATDGRYLFIYGLSVGSPSGKFACYPLTTPNGAVVSSGFPIRSDVGASPGQIYVYNSSSPPPEYLTFLTSNALDIQGEDIENPLLYFPGFPLQVLPPGMAFVVSETSASANSVSITFWWVAMKP